MKTDREKLRNEISSRLIPFLKKSGFDGPDKITGNKVEHEFKRIVHTELHLLSIQFDSHQRPRFIVNLEIYSTDGKIEYAARVQANPGSGLGSWFCADPPLWKKLLGFKQSREKEAVQQCIDLLPDIESWWQNHNETRNILNFPVP